MSPTRQSKRLQGAVEAAVKQVTKKVKTETTKKPASKKAKAETASVAGAEPAEGKSGKTDDSQAAWGALFSKKAKSPAKTAPGLLQPMAATPLSDEMKTRIKEYAAFEGVSSEKAKAGNTKVVAWNVNGLRAVLKREDGVHLRAYVAQEDPDIFCISETKIGAEDLQKLENCLPHYEHQYWSCASKKGYSGTAIFSKVKPLNVKQDIIVEGDKPDDEGRFLALEYDRFWLVHTYVPNAGQKLDRLDYRTKQWDKAMLKMLKDLEESGKSVVWCGDLNVAHQDMDIHDPKSNRNKSAGFTDAERESFGSMLDSGFVDTYRHLHPEEQQYTYFGYRFNMRAKNKGWRIDYFVVSQALMASVEAAFIRTSVVGSDHVPIGLEISDA